MGEYIVEVTGDATQFREDPDVMFIANSFELPIFSVQADDPKDAATKVNDTLGDYQPDRWFRVYEYPFEMNYVENPETGELVYVEQENY